LNWSIVNSENFKLFLNFLLLTIDFQIIFEYYINKFKLNLKEGCNMYVDIDSMRYYIEQSGIKQNWIAKKAGMTQNAIHLAMNKKRVLKADEYITICNLINVPLDKFVKKTIHK